MNKSTELKITRERDSAHPASKNECVVSDYFECECFLKFRHAQRKKTPLASRAFNEVITTAINGGIVIMRVPIFNAEIHFRTKKLLLILSFTTLTACNTTTAISDANTQEKLYVHIPRTYVSISCVSHDGAPYISDFSIEEPIASGPLGGKFAYGASCGGIIAAGYALPEKWTPGMKVRVRWKPDSREWIEKTTNIMKYDRVGNIYVHFFEHDQVRVVAANSNGASPHHPILSNVTSAPAEEQ
ncbi:hypothetical protein FHW67_001364 [Herbaspirillum sp. Sphag1AN]|uniref:DUF3304 domain-containing protein n=1 Tax=unclassified Herbaspirillum TaxID=2624150 RepID=UPI001617D37D|nr:MULTISPECIES: DUF3304 domain-containing protein [unclassified Herbaspirillum]MBB3212096.1 hypothetical protein [Herbaspirillum sp. Sphag1AN]MBB3244070.1 hypothetical protein [Herbaspirillum sp. Sphag64]